MKLDRETRMTISVLARNGQSGRAIARMMGVAENTVSQHLRRQASGAVDGRSRQEQRADGCAEAITHYLAGVGEARPGLAARCGRRAPRRPAGCSAPGTTEAAASAPRVDARRPGADPVARGVDGRPVSPTSSTCGSRTAGTGRGVVRADLGWHHVHEGLRRLGGAGGEWTARNGEPRCRRVESMTTGATGGAVHIDAVRHPQAKGRSSAGSPTGVARSQRRDWSGWDELQAWTDERVTRGRCGPARRPAPAWAAWQAKRLAARCCPAVQPGGDAHRGERLHGGVERRYSVPFARLGKVFRPRLQPGDCGPRPRDRRAPATGAGCATTSEATKDVLPPLPLGRMGGGWTIAE